MIETAFCFNIRKTLFEIIGIADLNIKFYFIDPLLSVCLSRNRPEFELFFCSVDFYFECIFIFLKFAIQFFKINDYAWCISIIFLLKIF
jgi:hypothetical protein